MEIKGYANALNTYKAGKSTNDKNAVSVKKATVKNEDKVEFNKSNINTVDSLKSELAKSINSGADSKRISELSGRIESGMYNIHGEIIAKSIID